MQDTLISWAQKTWNFLSGCSKLSEGCKFCYAMTLSLNRSWTTKPWTIQNEADNVVMKPHKLHEPYLLKEPTRIFVNSMSDLHHRVVPDWFRAAGWCVMLDLPQHIFMVLTKRSEALTDWHVRFLAAIKSPEFAAFRDQVKDKRVKAALSKEWATPWAPHIWQGVSVENSRVLHRLDDLRACGAMVKFVSAEPLLGAWGADANVTGIDWIIVGGESGQHMNQNPDRWMKQEWAREIKNLCVKAGVAYFYKQDSGIRTELRPWLIEEDGSKWRWHQWPGDLTPPVPLDDKGEPLSAREAELFTDDLTVEDCRQRSTYWFFEAREYQDMKGAGWRVWAENAALTAAYWARCGMYRAQPAKITYPAYNEPFEDWDWGSEPRQAFIVEAPEPPPPPPLQPRLPFAIDDEVIVNGHPEVGKIVGLGAPGRFEGKVCVRRPNPTTPGVYTTHWIKVENVTPAPAGAQRAAPLSMATGMDGTPLVGPNASIISVGWFDGMWHIKEPGFENSLCGIDWVGLPTTGPAPDCPKCLALRTALQFSPNNPIWVEPLTKGGQRIKGIYRSLDPDWPGTAKVTLETVTGKMNLGIALSALHAGEPPLEPQEASSPPDTSQPKPVVAAAPDDGLTEGIEVIHSGTGERGILRRIDRAAGRVYVQAYRPDGTLIDLRDSNDQPLLVEILLRHIRPAPAVEHWWIDVENNIFRDDRAAVPDAYAVSSGPYESEAKARTALARHWVQAPDTGAARAMIAAQVAAATAEEDTPYVGGELLIIRYNTTAYTLDKFEEYAYLKAGERLIFVRSMKRDLATFGVFLDRNAKEMAVSMAVIGQVPVVGTELTFAERIDDEIEVTRYRCDALPEGAKPGRWSFYSDWRKEWSSLSNPDLQARLDLGLHPAPEHAVPLPTPSRVPGNRMDKTPEHIPSVTADKSPVTTVVNFRDVKQHWDAETQTWDDPKYVYIGRANAAYRLPASKWANPFPAQPGRNPPESKADAHRRVITAYRSDLLKPHRADLLAQIEELRGKMLVCWCKTADQPDMPCHGDALLELLGERIAPPQPAPKLPTSKPAPIVATSEQMLQLALF